MKKMMMILVLLFAMVGSSFGGVGTLPEFYNVYTGQGTNGWDSNGAIRINAYWLDTRSNIKLYVQSEGGIIFLYESTNTSLGDEEKAMLSQIISAKNTRTAIVPFCDSVDGTNIFKFSMLVVQ